MTPRRTSVDVFELVLLTDHRDHRGLLLTVHSEDVVDVVATIVVVGDRRHAVTPVVAARGRCNLLSAIELALQEAEE